MILIAMASSGPPGAVRARNGSQRNQPPPDAGRQPGMFAQVKGSPFDSIRR